VSGDVYNLADCIIQQAVVGSGANQLLLGYLKHSLCSHLVSHAAVIKGISKHEILDKYHCVDVLLEFLDSIIDGVTCRSKPEEGVLPNAMLTLISFLMQIFHNALEFYSKNCNFNHEHKQLLSKTGILLEKIAANPFLLAVICLGKNEDTEFAAKLAIRLRDVDNIVNTVGMTQYAATYECLRKIVQIEAKNLEMVNFEPVAVEPITYCLQPLLAVNVLLNPSSEMVNEFLMVQRLKGYSDARLYCEIFRACFISLNNVTDNNRESMWCAFTFIKIPHILKQMAAQANGE
jgi:mediator of RNA polymerase II transcription subunit 24